MVDALTVGTYAIVAFALSPALIFLVYQDSFATQKSAIGSSQLVTPNAMGAESLSDLGAHSKTSIVSSRDNPEMVLAETYNEAAASEISRCAPSNFTAPLCQTTMSLLVNTCGENQTRVPACQDPRVELFRPG
ncbi:MAG: hypothetical protein ABI361_04745 [Nitrososphaera sp.]